MVDIHGVTEAEIQRFWNNISRDSRTGCWPWRAGRFKNGYGAFAYTGHRPGKAHRFSYLLHHGEIPEGALVMHTCDNRICVNPSHLKLGTAGDNARDSVTKGRWMSPARKAWLEKCPNLLERQKPGPPKPLPIGKKYGEIGIPEPGDGYDMGIFVILERPSTSPIAPGA